MFTKVFTIQSDQGYSVTIIDKVCMGYSEAEHNLKFNIKYIRKTAAVGYVIYRRSIAKWAVPHETETISDARRDKIVRNIKAALVYAGFRAEVDNSVRFLL